MRACSAVLLLASLACAGCRSHRAAGASDASDEGAAVEEPAAESNGPAGSEAPRMVAALKYETPIFNRPEFPPKDPARTADDKTQAVRLGSLRKGQRIAVKRDAGKGGGCSEGWIELVGGGFVCGRFVTTDFGLKELQSAPHAPFDDRPLPYDYGLNLTNGTPMYRRPPLRRERAVYEKGLLVAGKTDEDRAEAAKEIAAEKGETPWYLSDKPQRTSVTLDDLKGESALVEQRMVRGFYVALDQEVHAFAGKFWRTTRGSFIPFDHILVHKSTTEFEGVWVGHDDEPRKLPLAFVLRPLGARQYRFPTEGQAPTRGDKVPRFTIVGLTGKRVTYEERNFYETTEGWWLRDLDGTQTRPGPPPADLAPNEKWIDVNVSAQSLVAFEGTKPVFATWVSTGRRNPQDEAKDHPTPTGSFRIREKHVATTMDDDSATDGPYSIEDVPWVMYFEKGYALHGAFWHSAFGREHSHGCVNMTPHDAKELFAWVGPTLPPAWHAVRATAANPGTRVIVHE